MAGRTVVALMLFVALTPPVACGQATIGVVRSLEGSALIQRGDLEVPVAIGTRILEGDRIATGMGCTLGALMRDNASLSIGPGSAVSLDRFRFSPVAGEYGFLARLFRGTLAYVSGLIAKSSPQSVRFETPVASLAVRGTRFAARVDE